MGGEVAAVGCGGVVSPVEGAETAEHDDVPGPGHHGCAGQGHDIHAHACVAAGQLAVVVTHGNPDNADELVQVVDEQVSDPHVG